MSIEEIKKKLGEIGERITNKKVEPDVNKKIDSIETKKEFPELISLDDLMSMEFPENKWVIEKLIPLQGITIIAGAPGNFKTWILLSMAISISKGEDFLGKFPSLKSNILIIDEENPLYMIKDRSKLLGAAKALSIDIISQRGFLIEDDAWIKRILDICESKKIDVIFFDSLIRIHQAEENSATNMSNVFRRIKRFCRAGKTVIITHHERKEGAIKSSGQNRLRGSSDISAAVDSHLTVRKIKDDDKNKLAIEQPKLRQEQEIEPFEVSILKDGEEYR